jgi:hypothetical protein
MARQILQGGLLRAARRHLSLILLIATAALYLGHEHAANRRITPPNMGCRLSELAEKIPPPARLFLVSHHEPIRLVWIGTVPPFTIRSGPPCYAFDERGRLIDWSPETGEGGRLDKLAAASVHQGQPISLAEALSWDVDANSR